LGAGSVGGRRGSPRSVGSMTEQEADLKVGAYKSKARELDALGPWCLVWLKDARV